MRKLMPLAVLLLALSNIQGCSKQETADPGKPADSAAVDSKDSLVIELVGQDSVTVLELLRQNHHVESKSTAMGEFVVAIDSVANGSSAFWVYSVNDTTPKIASDKMFTRSGDRVTWRLRRQ